MSFGLRLSAAVTAGLCLLVSTASADWHQLNSGTAAELMSVHFPEGTLVGYAVGTDQAGGAAILKTTDGGGTWTQQFAPIVNGLNSVYFTSDDNGYAVGIAGAGIRTTDGGATWWNMTIPGTDVLNYVSFPDNGQTGYIGVYPRHQAGKVIKSTDGGSNWFEVSVGGPMSWSISCGMVTDNIGVAVGKEGMVYGTSGTAQDPQTTADIVAAAFSRADPNKGYLIGNDSTGGVIRCTDDGGATPWDSVRCLPITAWYGVDVPTAEVAYVCGVGGRIDRSYSDTVFYGTATKVTADIHGVCFPNGADTGYAVGVNGTILRTYDGGFPWLPSLAEGRGPARAWAGIRVLSNPSRHGISFHADADAAVTVFDAMGRVVVRRPVANGAGSIPVSKAGVYMVRLANGDFSTTQKLVVED